MAPNLLEISRNMKDEKNGNNTQYGTEVDIWSLGCIYYELFTGKRVFEDASDIEEIMEEMKKRKIFFLIKNKILLFF